MHVQSSLKVVVELLRCVPPGHHCLQTTSSWSMLSARRRARLNSLPSLLVWRYTPSSNRLKAWKSSREKKIPKSIGECTHPFFTLLLIGNGSEEEPSYWMMLCISLWKAVIILRSLEGHPILWSRVDSPFLLTKSRALVRSIKAMYNGYLCSRHFSCSCPSEKIMSIVDLPALNPHCASGYMRSESNCKQL